MPNLTTGFPSLNSGDYNKDMKEMREWAMSLTDELRAILCNLDAGNVAEAGTVKAQNIDTAQAKIKDAQIKSLTADKLTAGTIDTGEITISNSDGNRKMNIQDDSIVFYEYDNTTNENKIRIGMGRLEGTNKYIFTVQNSDKTQGLYMDDGDQMYFTGEIRGGKIKSDTEIDVGTVITVGKKITLQDTEKETGWENAATIAVSNEVLLISAANHRRIMLNTEGGAGVLINGLDIVQEIEDIKNKL